MRKILFIILLTTLNAQTPQAYKNEANAWWSESYQSQKDNALWYARHFGVDAGSKTILETSGGTNTDHGDEKSEGDLGLNVSLYPYRAPEELQGALQHWLDKTGIVLPVMTREAFVDSLKNGSMAWHGQLCRDKLDHDLYLMRHKANKEFDVAFNYPGWGLWSKRKIVWKIVADRNNASLDDEILLHKWMRRNHRALLDLAFQELLRKELKK
jgi:hypothetical protein